MTNTSNHNWDIPTVGGDEDVWGEILNDFFDDELDRQVKLEGPFVDRPAAGTDTVKYYHATDRRVVYYNDGSSWEALYGLGTDSNPVPGTSYFESVSTEESVTVTDGESDGTTIHYGSDQDRENAGPESVALGVGARATQIDEDGAWYDGSARITCSGYRAARNNTGFALTGSGYLAAENNTGDNVTVSGYEAAENNTGDRVTASGYRAVVDNTGNSVTASGYHAARDNTGFALTAIGHRAARYNTGDNVTVSGYQAARGDGLEDPTTMGDDNIGIGDGAIRNNQASGLIAIGQDAGINAQSDDQLIVTQRDGTRRMEMDLTTGDLSITGTHEAPAMDTDDASVSNQLEIPIYSDDTNAPNETHYFNDSESVLKYKDSDGTIHEGGGGATEYRFAGTTALDSDEYYSMPVYLIPDEQVEYSRIALSLSDGTTDTDVSLRFYDPDVTVVAEWELDSSPKIVDSFTQTEYQNSSTEDERAFWRIENNSTTDYTPDSTAADGIEYEITYRMGVPE